MRLRSNRKSRPPALQRADTRGRQGLRSACRREVDSSLRSWPWIAVIGWMSMTACQSEPITDERVARIVGRCCDEVRARIESVEDRQTAKFRDHCNACRVGAGKRQCEAGASAVLYAAMGAYPNGLTPVECTTLRSSLAEVGVSISEP
jgi:hypothetical protein